MQIKRFEARNMSEALKMIKKEFGEEAVILSARNNRTGRSIFGRNRTKGVVVTAAIDNQPVNSPVQGDDDSVVNDVPDRAQGGPSDASSQGAASRIIHLHSH